MERFSVALWILGMCLSELHCQELPTTICPDYVVEHKNLSCTCRAPDTVDNPDVSLTWPGHSETDRLTLTGVTRHDNGTKYTCQMVDGTETTSTVYTLRVAYGPTDAHTRITGPDDLVTDGTKKVTLTCLATHVYPEPEYTWPNVACINETKNTCTVVPEVPTSGEDSSGVKYFCTATNIHNVGDRGLVLSQAVFSLNLIYPPPRKPLLRTSDSQPLKSGDKVTCTVIGGHPMVSAVYFHCISPSLKDQKDIVRSDRVISSLIVDTSQATERNMTCFCTANWTPQPGLYPLQEQREFILEYRAQVSNVSINHSRELTVREDDKVTVTLTCEGSGRPPPTMSLHKDGNNTVVWFKNSSTHATGTGGGFTLRSVRCEDMGDYVCTADNDFPDPDTDTATLLVNCGPRPYNQSTTENTPPEVPPEGLNFLLVAHPTPRDFTIRFLGNDTVSKVTPVPGNMFSTVCVRRGWVTGPVVTCSIKPLAVAENYLGYFNLTISNGFGHFGLEFEVKTPVFRKPSHASVVGMAVGISFGVLFLVVLCVVGAICLVMKRRRHREILHDKRGDHIYDKNGTDMDLTSRPGASMVNTTTTATTNTTTTTATTTTTTTTTTTNTTNTSNNARLQFQNPNDIGIYCILEETKDSHTSMTDQSSAQKSTSPKGQPSAQKSTSPKGQPSAQKSTSPKGQPSAQKSTSPKGQPSAQKSTSPKGQPSAQKSTSPKGQSSAQKSASPTEQPPKEPLTAESTTDTCNTSQNNNDNNNSAEAAAAPGSNPMGLYYTLEETVRNPGPQTDGTGQELHDVSSPVERLVGPKGDAYAMVNLDRKASRTSVQCQAAKSDNGQLPSPVNTVVTQKGGNHGEPEQDHYDVLIREGKQLKPHVPDPNYSHIDFRSPPQET